MVRNFFQPICPTCQARLPFPSALAAKGRSACSACHIAVEHKPWTAPAAIAAGFLVLIAIEAFLGASGAGFWACWLIGLLIFVLATELVHVGILRYSFRIDRTRGGVKTDKWARRNLVRPELDQRSRDGWLTDCSHDARKNCNLLASYPLRLNSDGCSRRETIAREES